MADNTDKKTSLLINKQLPAFVREEHETFVKFLEYYYAFLEQDGGQQYVAKNFNRYLDIDNIKKDLDLDAIYGDNHIVRETDDYHAFLHKMYDTYIKFIPDTVLADKSLLVKHAKEFYRSAGSEKSVRFLMRALFDKEVEFYYPKSDILRASDGKWFIEKSLKITDISVNNTSNSIAISNFVNKQIKGKTSGATALVERVDSYFDKGQAVTELKLSGIYKQFQEPETVYCFYTEEGVDKYLSANLFSGVITAVTINAGGSGYTEGSTIPIKTSTGSGAQVVVSKVTKGAIQSVGVISGGAGFRITDPLVFFGSGYGATGNVSNVNTNEAYHPNSYNVMWTTINLEANTPIGNAKYSNLASSIVDPANNWVTNSMSYFVYANCGPAVACSVGAGGSHWVPPISISISANSIISKMGILGRMDVITKGTGYANGDLITFTNKPGSTGSGALGYVNVNATGAIVTAKFLPVAGQITGGSGYDWLNLPVATVNSTLGTGANVVVSAIIGHNESLTQSLSNIGTIQAITIVSGGSKYLAGDSLYLNTLGDGTANAKLTIVSGAIAYPGRYINDDGHISGYNFLEDRDYYQGFSYVIKVDETINKYRDTVKTLTHPAGAKMFGEYTKVFDQAAESNNNVAITYANTESNTLAYSTLYQTQGFATGTFAPNVVFGYANAELIQTSCKMNTTNHLSTFVAQTNRILIYYPSHTFVANDKVFLHFQTNASANIQNTNYTVSSANSDYLILSNPLTETISGNTGNVRVYNPDITITVPFSLPNNGTNIYLQWANSLTNVDTSLANGFYQVYDAYGTTFNVCHPSMLTSVSSSNSVNVITKKVQVTANNHEFAVGQLAYIQFISGDTANNRNAYYTVTEVGSNNKFNIAYQNTIFAGATTKTFQRRSKIVITGTTFANGNSIYVSFASGDQANTTNATYSAIKIAADTLTINTAKPATANATVRVWSSQNNYTNVRFTTLRSTQMVPAGSNVWVEFPAASSDLANGIFRVNTVYGASNSYNVSYYANTYVNKSSNTVNYSGLGVMTASQLEGLSLVSIYK